VVAGDVSHVKNHPRKINPFNPNYQRQNNQYRGNTNYNQNYRGQMKFNNYHNERRAPQEPNNELEAPPSTYLPPSNTYLPVNSIIGM
jgi:hypothetical protein